MFTEKQTHKIEIKVRLRLLQNSPLQQGKLFFRCTTIYRIRKYIKAFLSTSRLVNTPASSEKNSALDDISTNNSVFFLN